MNKIVKINKSKSLIQIKSLRCFLLINIVRFICIVNSEEL